jgi:hypothetical protein
MERLLAAEGAYVEALQEAFGIAATIDELAKAPGPQLPFAGHFDVRELFLPRPFHSAFADKPVPLFALIGAAMAAEAERVAKEL